VTENPNILLAGSPSTLGATPTAGGVNFAIFSRNAEALVLSVYARAEDAKPILEFRLDPHHNRTGDIWHVFVAGLGPGAFYLWHAEGPYIPTRGLRFNRHRGLVDPYAKALSTLPGWHFSAARAYDPESSDGDLSYSDHDNTGLMPKCVVVADSFDWQGDRPLNYPLRHCVIYEAHVKGLSRHESAKAKFPGTYKGVVEMIPHLKSLGITSVEFLPVMEFDENEVLRKNPRTGERLRNYWGYSTIAFFAPKASYAASQEPGGQVEEFKFMVRELHRAGLEVILDIVFNHTAEGNEYGPTLSFRGLDNPIYYLLDENHRFYRNFSGCGNTLNCNHPVVRSLIRDALHYWVCEMHIDGFRFDLGSILGRDQNGKMLENPPVLEEIAEDPILRHTKIIAEAWDAGGAYQVGWFPGGRWAEWNDRFRDDVRRFWRGDDRAVQGFATRVTGSSDLYLRDGRKPFHSINYLTSHDGFTLRDLVTYNAKHNDDNGEGNRDGGDGNWSYNYGAEGELPIGQPRPVASCDDAEVTVIRERQARNILATLLLSIGTPMLLGGDEFLRTQKGNNHAYCQDNDISWFDYSLVKDYAGHFRFARELVAFRLRHPAFRRPEFFTGRDADYNAIPDIVWYDDEGLSPDWARVEHMIAWRMDGSRADIISDRDDNDFLAICNAWPEARDWTIHAAPRGKIWTRVIDTALPSPHDIVAQGLEEAISPQTAYRMAGRSFVLLMSKTL
jgi:glycogen operon protein